MLVLQGIEGEDMMSLCVKSGVDVGWWVVPMSLHPISLKELVEKEGGVTRPVLSGLDPVTKRNNSVKHIPLSIYQTLSVYSPPSQLFSNNLSLYRSEPSFVTYEGLNIPGSRPEVEGDVGEDSRCLPSRFSGVSERCEWVVPGGMVNASCGRG